MTITPTQYADPDTRAAAGVAHLLFFGKVADRFGAAREAAIPAGGCTLAQLRAWLAQAVEGGAEALDELGLRIAVDQELADDGAWVRPGQEVAFFSVFSGG